MAQPAQVSGGGWTTDKPVGGQKEHPKPEKKCLKAKMVKNSYGRQYIKGPCYGQ